MKPILTCFVILNLNRKISVLKTYFNPFYYFKLESANTVLKTCFDPFYYFKHDLEKYCLEARFTSFTIWAWIARFTVLKVESALLCFKHSDCLVIPCILWVNNVLIYSYLSVETYFSVLIFESAPPSYYCSSCIAVWV